MAYEVTNFQKEVLEKSHETPVLVDFWAPWCGPCRTLGPVLEKLAGENSNAWTLAKLDTDENPEVSTQYGIRGIPAVKLFVDGQVVNEFTGALPEYAVRQWLDEALPSKAKKHMAQAEAALATNRPDLRTLVLSNDLARWRAALVNDFEKPVFEVLPAIRAVKEDLLEAGAGYAAMSGSGSAVFGVFETQAQAAAAAEAARRKGHHVWQGDPPRAGL